MTEYVSAELRRMISSRADGCCEYCLIHESHVVLTHEPDHIVAIKHGGKTTEENLAWACFLCNRFKGSDLASIDPQTGDVVRLFHPRHDHWTDHFRMEEDGTVIPLTDVGRATVQLLRLNLPESILTRRELIIRNQFHRPI